MAELFPELPGPHASIAQRDGLTFLPGLVTGRCGPAQYAHDTAFVLTFRRSYRAATQRWRAKHVDFARHTESGANADIGLPNITTCLVSQRATSIVPAMWQEQRAPSRRRRRRHLLPNHSPLILPSSLERWHTLVPAALISAWPARPAPINAPCAPCAGTCQHRRDAFPQDVLELMPIGSAFAHNPCALSGRRIGVPVWILVQPLRRPACRGLGSPTPSRLIRAEQLEPAIAIYRERFRPSLYLRALLMLVGSAWFAAETDARREVVHIAAAPSSISAQAGASQLPPPSTLIKRSRRSGQGNIGSVLACAFVGSPATVEHDRRPSSSPPARRTHSDSANFDHAARLRSFGILDTSLRRVSALLAIARRPFLAKHRIRYWIR